MGSIPLITSDRYTTNIVSEILGNVENEHINCICLNNADIALEFMAIEMPELIFINFSDPNFSGFELLERIAQDGWLLNAGIIAFCSTAKEVDEIENVRNANLIIALTTNELEYHLPKILSIIFKNRRIIFQRIISTDLINNLSGSFSIENDPYEARCYANLMCNFLHNSNHLTNESKFQLKLALTEMLLNSIEHGNCGITYEAKTQWMEKNFDIYELIVQRLENPSVASRKVLLEYSLTLNKGIFVITDEGEGFDWKNIKDASSEENILELHGRGILMTRAVVSNLSFNEKGNQVSFEIAFKEEKYGTMPDFFKNLELKEFNSGDVVFNQSENSDFLYYIVEGRYSVHANGHLVSVLTPDDMFMGEMSFLLNNQRSAAVIAETKGKLIQISKKQFVEVIKEKPHYALFLCRLLAQRIQRSNQRKR